MCLFRNGQFVISVGSLKVVISTSNSHMDDKSTQSRYKPPAYSLPDASYALDVTLIDREENSAYLPALIAWTIFARLHHSLSSTSQFPDDRGSTT